LQIVGVVKTAKYHSVWEEPVPMLYRPLQRERLAQATLLIRTHSQASSAASLAPAIRELIQQLDHTLPMAAPLTWSDQIQQAVAPQRAAAALLGMFSISALVLASVGLYSVLAYAVAQRTREIGVRIALGAEPAHVRRQVIGRGVLLTGIGLGIGGVFSSILAPLFATLLPGILTTDPITLGAVSLLLLTVATIASLRPAQSASRVDPLKAIRAE
jgi:ABC-type lipoprotein release transport system permease subunit